MGSATENAVHSETSSPISALRAAFHQGRASIEQKLGVCTGMIPLESADQAELLILISQDADQRIADRALSSLRALPPEAFIAALGRTDAHEQVFAYCAKNIATQPEIAAAILGNPACSEEILTTIVQHLPADSAKALADNLELLATKPILASTLLATSVLSLDQRKILEELGQGAPDAEALAEAISDVEPDPAKRLSLLQRLAKMRVTERVQLAFKGGREERMALIRDSCKVVQRAVLMSPKLSEQEVEGFASITSLGDEVLRIIAGNRAYRKNYVVTHNLLFNPKTPLDISLHLLPHANPADMRTLAANKNVPETLRTTATKFHRQRTMKKD